MPDTPRRLHFVGSLPPEIKDDRPGLQWMLDHCADLPVTAIPRDQDPNWVIHYLRSLEKRPTLVVNHEGAYRSYDDFRTYAVAPGHILMSDDVSMRRTGRIRGALDIFRGLRAQHPSLAAARFQVSLPHPLDLALFTFAGSAVRDGLPLWPVLRQPHLVRRALRHLPAFTAALVREVAELTETDGDDLMWQIESPVATLAVVKATRCGTASIVSRLAATQISDFLIRLPSAARTTLHLCYGDYRKQPLLRPTSLAPVVALLNQVGRRLHAQGESRPPVHVPCAYGVSAPPDTERFFRPLANLEPGWSLIAGVAAPENLATCRRALERFERHSGRRCHAVAASCGLGRMTVAQAEATAHTMLALATHVAA